MRPDVQISELALRDNLNLKWCCGVLFNVNAFKNMANKVEFDAIIWNDKAMLNQENPVKFDKELILRELKTLLDKIEQVNR